MDTLEVGMRFPSYKVLMEAMEHFCQQTQSKFWKRDARTIAASRTSGVHKYLNPNIVYFEIKFTCVYGGMGFKSKGKNIRNRVPSLKASGCPAYLRFKASEDGEALQLVAKNLRHNHELKLPERKTAKQTADTPLYSAKRRKRLQMLEKLENVEIERHEDFLEPEATERSPEAEVVEYIELSEEDIKMNLAPFVYRGLIAPVFTPFNDDLGRTLNLQIIPAYAEHLVNSGISAVLVGGTTGEGTSMTVEERKLVTEVWAQVCAQTQQHLMVQVGGAPLPDVLELAQHAEEKGVNSMLCLPELYHKPTTSADLIRYLQIISQAAPNTPLFYYHIPSLTNVNINMGTFLKEVGDSIPTFGGIKFTSTMLDEGLSAVKANDGKFAVFLGADSIMAGAYALGFDSAIATTFNMFAQHGQQILQAIRDGNVGEGQTTQDELNSAISIITKNGTWVPTMKEAMNLLTPINVGPIREPLAALTPEQVKQLEDELKDMKFIST